MGGTIIIDTTISGDAKKLVGVLSHEVGMQIKPEERLRNTEKTVKRQRKTRGK